MIVLPRKTGRPCAQCGHDIEPGVRQAECEVCGAWPLCNICILGHREDNEHWKEPPDA